MVRGGTNDLFFWLTPGSKPTVKAGTALGRMWSAEWMMECVCHRQGENAYPHRILSRKGPRRLFHLGWFSFHQLAPDTWGDSYDPQTSAIGPFWETEIKGQLLVHQWGLPCSTCYSEPPCLGKWALSGHSSALLWYIFKTPARTLLYHYLQQFIEMNFYNIREYLIVLPNTISFLFYNVHTIILLW